MTYASEQRDDSPHDFHDRPQEVETNQDRRQGIDDCFWFAYTTLYFLMRLYADCP